MPRKRVRSARRFRKPVWGSRKSVWGSKKRVQERFEVSWYSRRSELVKWQYNPNDHKWGIFGCINLYPSDWDQWLLRDSVTRFLGFLRKFLRILDGFLGHFWWKYWCFSKDLFINFLDQRGSSLYVVKRFLVPLTGLLDLQDLLDLLTRFLSISVHFLEFCWWKVLWMFQLCPSLHQKKSRKRTNIARKRVRRSRSSWRSRNSVWGSRKPVNRHKEDLCRYRKFMN